MGHPDPWLGMTSILFLSPHVAVLASTDPQIPRASPIIPLPHVHTNFPLTPLWGCYVKSNTPVSKISSQDMNSLSGLCHPLPFTSSSEISNNFHYCQTRCFLAVCYFPTTGICRQEKYSCYTALTGLLCGFTGRRLAVECHTPLYHGLRAGTSIHFMHCVSRNFPGCGRESCCLLSELCKKLFFGLSKKS